MLLSALAALFLLAFGLGIFWRSPNRHDLLFFTCSNMVKSFYIGWYIFLISYFSPLGEALPILSILAAGAAAVILMMRLEAGEVLMPSIQGSRLGKSVMGVALAIALGVTLVEASRPIGEVWTFWDSIASWNRWARELYANDYKPMNAAYPILMPALWSLIYEAQSGPDLWVFSRALISVIPLSIMALAAYAGLRNGVIPFVALSLALIFGFVIKVHLYSGYMDQPSALLAVGGMLFSALALSETKTARRNEFLLLGVMSVTLAVLTKQHAIFAAFAVCSLVALMALRRQISFVRAASFAAVFLIPVLSFLFIYLQKQDTLWGNIPQLNAASERIVGDQSKVFVAVKTLGAELPVPVWIMLALGTLANVAFFRKPQALFALFIAALTIPGFFVYADCCSYSQRNGMWILGHLSVSCFVGVSLLVERLDERGLIPGWLVSNRSQEPGEGLPVPSRGVYLTAAVAAVGLIVVSIEWPMSRLMDRQLDQQRHRIVPRLQTMLERNPGMMDFATDLVTPIALMKMHPDVTQAYYYCRPLKISCLENRPVGKTMFATTVWFENDESKALIDRLVAEGKLKRLDSEMGMTVYKLQRPVS